MQTAHTDVRRTQDRLLEMAIAVRNILEKHQIRYMMAFGTLLGAIRHGGFIPWDDDFDLYLFGEDYDWALTVLRDELPDDLFLEYKDSEPLYFHAWAHVKDLKTIATCEQFPQDSLYAHKGLSIDLYVTYTMKEKDLNLFRLNESLAYQKRLHYIGYTTDEIFAQKEKEITALIAEEKTNNHSSSEREILGNTFKSKYLEIADVFPLRKYKFENEEFYGPHDANAVLTHIYGDYMKLPPEEDRIPHYGQVTFLE